MRWLDQSCLSLNIGKRKVLFLFCFSKTNIQSPNVDIHIKGGSDECSVVTELKYCNYGSKET